MSIDRLSIVPGDTVDVPWGFDTFPATVLEVYESGGQQRVRVRLLRSDNSAPEEAVFRVGDLAASPPESKYTRPGSWQHVREYEDEFVRVVQDLLENRDTGQEMHPHVVVDHNPDFGDLIARFDDNTVVFELKWQLHEVRNAVSQASNFAAGLRRLESRAASVIIVSPNFPRAFVSALPGGPTRLAPDVYFVRWSGPNDNGRLGDALGLALSSASGL